MRSLVLLLAVAGGVGAWYWLRPDPGAGSVSEVRGSAHERSVPEPTPDAGRVPAGGSAMPSVPAGAVSEAPESADPADEPWVRRNNRAVQHLNEGEPGPAVELLEGCHEARPEDDAFRRNLVEALVRLAREEYASGDLEPAVTHLERAVDLGRDRTDREALRALAERWRRELEARRDHWTDESLYFELSYDADRFDVLAAAQTLLNDLERMYGELRDWFGRDPIIEEGHPRIRVVLYEADDFRNVTGLGDWAAGAFDGVIAVSLADLESQRATLRTTLRHELVHAFVHAVGRGGVPGWLNEGLAQWLELAAAPAQRESVRTEAAQGRLAGQALLPLERLRGSLVGWDDEATIRRAYDQSFLLVRRIAIDPNYGEEVLRRMVLAAAAGGSAEEAFEGATSVPLSFVLELVETGR